MSSSRQHGGLGLGLSIVRHIAELHGGSVHASSHGAGKGSTFTLEVPIAPAKRRGAAPLVRDPDVDVAAAAPQYAARGGLTGLKILVVDDEPDARELLAHMLELHRAAVLTAGSAEEALRLFVERRPDVLISDIAMPGEDGYSLITRIRALPVDQGGRTPAIALTAYARTADRTRALLSGFTMHVPKPVDPVELLAVVETVTERRRSSPGG